MSRLRDKKITIRLTDDEYKLIIKKLNEAKKIQKSMFHTYADYIMYCVSNFQINVIKTELIEKELKAIGKNINQWTKSINTYNEVDKEDVNKLEGEIGKIWQCLRFLKSETQKNIKDIPSKTK